MTPPHPSERFVLPETRALAVLGCFDLLATIFLLATHKAQEANPIMAGILARFGPAGFAVLKGLLLGVPLVIAEMARKRSPIFVPRALRVGLVAYVVLLLFAYREPLSALFGHRG
jgi:hypothetical protein